MKHSYVAVSEPVDVELLALAYADCKWRWTDAKAKFPNAEEVLAHIDMMDVAGNGWCGGIGIEKGQLVIHVSLATAYQNRGGKLKEATPTI